jgi:hypothetical protein
VSSARGGPPRQPFAVRDVRGLGAMRGGGWPRYMAPSAAQATLIPVFC